MHCDGPCELPKGAYEFRAFNAFGSLPVFAIYNEFSGYKPSLIQGALCVWEGKSSSVTALEYA